MAKSKNASSRRSVLDYINTQAVKPSSTDEHRKGPKSQASGIQALSVMPAHHEPISADAEERYTGKCLCGQISYEVSGKPVYCALCHCVNCKRWTGSGSMWFAVFSKQNVRYTKGEDLLQTYADGETDSGGTALRNSCGKCSSPLTVVLPHRENITGIVAGSANGDISEVWKPQTEVYCKDRPKWLPDLGVAQYNVMPSPPQA